MNKERFTVDNYDEFNDEGIIYYDDGEEMGWLDVCDKLNEYEKRKQETTIF